MAGITQESHSGLRLLGGFVAGFVATLIFHQLSLWVLWNVNFAPFAPFNMEATRPLGVPVMFSLAFWGGVWGIIFAAVDRRFPSGAGYYVTAFLFGALLPSIVALFVIVPLKGGPLGGGFAPALLVTAFVINGAWGFGTGLILRALDKLSGSPQPQSQ